MCLSESKSSPEREQIEPRHDGCLCDEEITVRRHPVTHRIPVKVTDNTRNGHWRSISSSTNISLEVTAALHDPSDGRHEVANWIMKIPCITRADYRRWATPATITTAILHKSGAVREGLITYTDFVLLTKSFALCRVRKFSSKRLEMTRKD